MKQTLFNNGFLVKAAYSSPNAMYPPLKSSYRGIGKFTSWPLEWKNDIVSKSLDKEAWDKWFGYQNVFEVVPDKQYLQRYIEHCNELEIKTMLLMIETPLDMYQDVDSLEVIECLGFDIMDCVGFSYLVMDIDYYDPECAVFSVAKKLNSNGLYASLDDAYEHINVRDSLLMSGVNLEHSDDWGPFPARLSIVKL